MGLGYCYGECRDSLLSITVGRKKDPFYMNIRNPRPKKCIGSLTLIQISRGKGFLNACQPCSSLRHHLSAHNGLDADVKELPEVDLS